MLEVDRSYWRTWNSGNG